MLTWVADFLNLLLLLRRVETRLGVVAFLATGESRVKDAADLVLVTFALVDLCFLVPARDLFCPGIAVSELCEGHAYIIYLSYVYSMLCLLYIIFI